MIYHRDAGTGSRFLHEEPTERVIGAVELHRGLGLLESEGPECRCHEFHLRGIRFYRQDPLPVEYKGSQAGLPKPLVGPWKQVL
jgi:hypothetical protein